MLLIILHIIGKFLNKMQTVSLACLINLNLITSKVDFILFHVYCLCLIKQLQGYFLFKENI